jgi:hypothetical protein
VYAVNRHRRSDRVQKPTESAQSPFRMCGLIELAPQHSAPDCVAVTVPLRSVRE